MKLPVILAGVAAVVLLAAGYFFVLPMLRGTPAAAVDEEDEDPAPVAAARSKKDAAHEPGLIYPMPERVLNLATSGGVPHYARIELALEFERPAGAKAAKSGGGGHGAAAGAAPPLDPALEPVAERKAKIDDAVLRIVGTRTLEEMTTNEGREHLKQEILESVAELIGSRPEITGVYIVRLIVQ
jgi:flagellar basal body-associated protein FliL